jgi:hypothetical protein
MIKKMATLMLTLALVVVVSGCAEKDPFTVVKKGAVKLADVKSYAYEGALSLKIKDGSSTEDEQMNQIIGVLNNAKLTYAGISDLNKKQQSMTLGVEIEGDMQMKVSIQVIVSGDDIYVKVPNIPMLQLPKELVGKYVHINLKDEQNKNEKLKNVLSIDKEKQKQLSKEILSVLNDGFKADKNFTIVDNKDLKIEGVKGIVEYKITNDNVQAIITNLANNVIPGLLNVLSKPEWSTYTSVTADDVKTYKDGLKDLDKGMEEFKKAVDLKNVTTLFGTDKSGTLTYFKQTIGVAVTNDSGKAEGELTADLRLSRFNDKELIVTIPAKSEMKELADTGLGF